MNSAAILLCALLLDSLFGEPRWLWSRTPHPIVLMGRLIGWADTRFNNGSKWAGAGVIGALVVFGVLIGIVLTQFGAVMQILVVAILVAHKSLIQHMAFVAQELRLSLPAGRRAVGLIVSRDTSQMTPSDTASSAIESGAENLSDGVIAPAFWFLVAGLPGIIVYKLVNTADSMVGYRTPRHAQFGWAAARLDDVLNWVPARLTALMLWIVGGACGSWPQIITDARLHKSPNAGWPEAALARSLGTALAGPRRYHGILQDLPWVNASGRRALSATDIDLAIHQLWRVWVLSAMVCAGMAFAT